MEIILKAIEILKKTFGGTKVELISSKLERSSPSTSYPCGYLFVELKIEGETTLLSYTTAEDILVYGETIAQEVVYPCIAEKYKLYERKLKIKKIKDRNEGNHSS